MVATQLMVGRQCDYSPGKGQIVLKLLASLACISCIMASTAFTEPPVLAADKPAIIIPDDYLGLSFETSNLLPDGGRYLFSAENKSLINLFRVLGIKSLRMGGGTADMPSYQIPGPKDIDNLFAFAKAADVSVIYTLRLPGSSTAQNVEIAKYTMERYASRLTCFAIGNESDFYRHVYTQYKDYNPYRVDWEKQASAITAAVPNAKFCGPNTGGRTEARSIAWTTDFARDFGKSGNTALIAQHYYGAGANEISTPTDGIDRMLSPAWLNDYQSLYDSFAVPVLKDGLAYQLEEVNSISGGVPGATNTFAAALWVLDFLHWWAAHGASGVNIHNRRWIPNIVIYPTFGQNYTINPIGYGIKAFDLAGHGRVEQLAVDIPDGMNLAAYGVRQEDSLMVTIINKTHDADARAANVNLQPYAFTGNASVLYLTTSSGDVSTRTGITLGGAVISDDGTWQGKWTPLDPPLDPINGRLVVTVPPASAVIVKMEGVPRP